MKMKSGRKPGPRRIRINAVEIESGRKSHVFSVTTTADVSTVMRVLQALRDNPAGLALLVKGLT